MLELLEPTIQRHSRQLKQVGWHSIVNSLFPLRHVTYANHLANIVSNFCSEQ